MVEGRPRGGGAQLEGERLPKRQKYTAKTGQNPAGE